MKVLSKRNIGLISLFFIIFLVSPNALISQDELEVVYNISDGELPSWTKKAGKYFMEGGNRVFICEAKTHNLHNSLLLARLRFKRMLVEYISVGVLNQASNQLGEHVKNLIATRSQEEINFICEQVWYLRKIKFNRVICFQAYLKTIVNEQALEDYFDNYVNDLR